MLSVVAIAVAAAPPLRYDMPDKYATYASPAIFDVIAFCYAAILLRSGYADGEVLRWRVISRGVFLICAAFTILSYRARGMLL